MVGPKDHRDGGATPPGDLGVPTRRDGPGVHVARVWDDEHTGSIEGMVRDLIR